MKKSKCIHADDLLNWPSRPLQVQIFQIARHFGLGAEA
eukprot:CAMPEP_0184734478 /NCGR_PEP_ID=MMETSP0314-20130426/60622_1 /TAXON_ID=38298 /ORGANISM="Rhodella maculata, Strain CCMP 736" /LENGTH=37 /DNA_ID= /DNA_START= /DNA_END= /DNA_ORIENTATION=